MTATRSTPIDLDPPSISSTLDRRFWLVAALGTLASGLLFGLVSAIIPNPIFGRTIPPDGPAIAIWLASAPLMGSLVATAMTAPAGATVDGGPDVTGRGFTLGSVAAFLAIGCPVCNKVVLLALGTTGAMNVFAPIQPLIGIGSLLLLAWTVRWSLRRRASGCAVAPSAP